jgi:hypothetical protein
MKKWTALVVVLLIVVWWIAAAPRREIRPVRSAVFDPSLSAAINAVDHSAEFAAGIEHFPSALPNIDDVAFLGDGARALVTATDGKIWTIDLATNTTQPFVDAPLNAYGIHDAPGDPNHVYFCASQSYSKPRGNEPVGLYRLALDTRVIDPLVVKVPATGNDHKTPVVYADDDSNAPELRRDGSGGPHRALVVCDDLELSEDGRRIYFSEPFDYQGATLDDAVDEAIALSPNARLWRYDLDSGTTRLIAEGFHFINGILYDLHPGQPREESVIVTQTSEFRLTRFYLRGPKAGKFEIVLNGLTGMADGMNRDAAGRIWFAVFAERTPLLTWLHAHAWIKPLFMRLPTKLLLSQAKHTGAIVVSPDGRTPLYSAMYQGPAMSALASTVPSPRGIYLANEPLGSSGQEKSGVLRLKWPSELR